MILITFSKTVKKNITKDHGEHCLLCFLLYTLKSALLCTLTYLENKETLNQIKSYLVPFRLGVCMFKIPYFRHFSF